MKKIFAIAMAALMMLSVVLSGCGKDEPTGSTPLHESTDAPATEPQSGGNPALAQAQDAPGLYLLAAMDKTGQAIRIPVSAAMQALMEALESRGSLTVASDGNVLRLDYDVTNGYLYAAMPVYGEDEDLRLYLRDNQLCISAPALLGENGYGMSLDITEETLRDCAVWEVLGISYDDVKDRIADALESMTVQDGNAAEDLVESMQRLEVLLEQVTWQAADVKNGTAVEISCAMTARQFQTIMSGLLEEAELWLPLFAQDESGRAEQMLAQMKALLESTEAAVTFKATVSNDTGLLTAASFRVSATAQGSTAVVEAVCDLSDLHCITLSCTAAVDGQSTGADLLASVAINDAAGNIDRKVSLKVGTEEVSVLLRYDGVNFCFALTADGETAELLGKLTVSETGLTLSDLSVPLEGGKEVQAINLTLTLTTEVALQELPSYINLITDLRAEEWAAILEALGLIGEESAVCELCGASATVTCEEDGQILYLCQSCYDDYFGDGGQCQWCLTNAVDWWI